MRYWPVASVTEALTFSISALLAASTVTPGMTAPDESLTSPAIDEVWADTAEGSTTSAANTSAVFRTLRITPLSFGTDRLNGRIMGAGARRVKRKTRRARE